MVKILKKDKILSIALLGLLLISLALPLIEPYIITEKEVQELDPKTQANQISIVNPENRTYSVPMNGYYPGTCGFEEEADGNNPEGWEIYEGGGTINTISEYNGHKKVIELYDSQATNVRLSQVFPQESGTVELWWSMDDVTDQCDFWLSSDTNNLRFRVQIIFDKFRWYDGDNHDVGLSASDSQWYHIRVDFDFGAGIWDLWIDGVKYSGTGYGMHSSTLNFDGIDFRTSTSAGDYRSYIDAIGYSWDPSYSVGDNENEGLLVSYANTPTLDWTGYSMDGQPNVTITGNTTIPFPNIGTHNIQIFGNDSLNNHFVSDIRYFTVKGINILSPENKTYTSIEGYYPATYGFDADAVDSQPNHWIVDESDGCELDIAQEIGGHKKVVDIYDHAYTTGGIKMYNVFSSQNQGTIEFWWRTTTSTKRTHCETFDASNNILLYLQFYDNGYIRGSNDGSMANIMEYSANTWYHFRVDFNSNVDLYNLSINGNRVATGYDFYHSAGAAVKFLFSSQSDQENYHQYVDAVGYSWDPNYDIGDNLNKGLLLSFNHIDNLTWMGYSLDGQSNQTITENKVIKRPAAGSHTIQVFGNDSLGNKYESNLVSFTTKDLEILTPESKMITELDQGYYPGTYSFAADTIGQPPAGWSLSETGGTVTVINEKNPHKQVVKFADTSSSGHASMARSIPAQTNGTVEWWWYTTDNDNQDHPPTNFLLYTASTWVINIEIRAYSNFYHNGKSIDVISNANRWYHLRVDFNSGSETYNVSIDGDLWVEDASYMVSGGGDIVKISSSTSGSGANYETYIDAIGCSWDEDYMIGNNEEEGLLLTYESYETLKWVGYSLDGQAIQTIPGKYVLANPIPGEHTIQLFANGTSGLEYSSELRNFTVYIGGAKPDAPLNFELDQAYFHIFLSWEEPADNNAPISHYNIYRSEIPGELGSILDTSTIPEYNDSSAIVGVRYYYRLSAVNPFGEGPLSEQLNGEARDSPFVEWNKPFENERIIFPVGNYIIFNFKYDFDNQTTDDVELFLNDINYGSVLGKTSLNTTYAAEIDGLVNATLIGYDAGIPYVNDTRFFTFSKLIAETPELLDSDMEHIGNQLYLILHDPSGDNSYTSFSETTRISMGVSTQIMESWASCVEVGYDAGLFGVGIDASAKLSHEETTEEGYDFRYEVVDTTELYSSFDSTNKDYIGPGYGDRYWGEAWTLKWELRADYREYFNGTKKHESPKLVYGIVRSGESFLNDVFAPESWRVQNPVHNGWQNIDWINTSTYYGGAPVKNIHSVTSTTHKYKTETIEICDSAQAKLSYGGFTFGASFSLNITTKNYQETTSSSEIVNEYCIYDDESTDVLVQDYGIDKKFGTFIFKPHEFMSETSNPLEHNTTDYIPPLIDFPEIELDSNNDGIGPCMDDNPNILVHMEDEGGINYSLIYYSINDGVNWDTALLKEQAANPEYFWGYIPGRAHGTIVLWYIRAWDSANIRSERMDPFGNYFKYTVKNRLPSVRLSSPIGGELYEDLITIEWEGSDPDADDLTYTISYTKGGGGWILIQRDVTGSSYEWDISSISRSNTVLLKIIADDGYGGRCEYITEYVFSIEGPPAPEDLPILEGISIAGLIGLAAMVGVLLIKQSKR